MADTENKEAVDSLYESYRAQQKGSITTESYSDAVLKAADPSTEVKQEYMKHIISVADFSDMKLSPETLKIYAILRGEHIKNQEEMDDQSMLAEILYRQGEYHSLNKLLSEHPDFFN